MLAEDGERDPLMLMRAYTGYKNGCAIIYTVGPMLPEAEKTGGENVPFPLCADHRPTSFLVRVVYRNVERACARDLPEYLCLDDLISPVIGCKSDIVEDVRWGVMTFTSLWRIVRNSPNS